MANNELMFFRMIKNLANQKMIKNLANQIPVGPALGGVHHWLIDSVFVITLMDLNIEGFCI